MLFERGGSLSCFSGTIDSSEGQCVLRVNIRGCD
jgi:hypothetical protein